jgi:hypothetical protein
MFIRNVGTFILDYTGYSPIYSDNNDHILYVNLILPCI